MAMVREFAEETGVAVPDEDLVIDVLNKKEFINRGDDGAPPIFIDDIARGDTDHFTGEVRSVRYELRLFDNRIVHPAALAGLLPCRTKTYMFTGFPSSGNMIFQRCLSGVLAAAGAKKAPVSRSRLEGLLTHYALSHWYTTSDLFVSHFQDDGLYANMGAPCGFGLGGVYMEAETPLPIRKPERSQAGTICISGFGMWHHAWANPYHASHEPITPASVAAYRARNVSCVQLVRHPLDVLVSIAGKLASTAYSEVLSAKEARNQGVICIMNRDAWVHSMIDTLENYYCAIAATKNDVDYLTYEDLLSDPVATIRKLAATFGCSVTDEAAHGIWQLWVDIPAAGPGHRWDPRAEKWKEFMPARFAGRLIGSKLEVAAREFGYSFSREDFRGPSRVSDEVELDYRVIALEEGRYNVLVGKEIVISDNGFYAASNRETGLFASAPIHARASVDRLLNSPLAKDVLKSISCFEVLPELRMEHYVTQAKPAMEVSEQWRAIFAKEGESDVPANNIKMAMEG